MKRADKSDDAALKRIEEAVLKEAKNNGVEFIVCLRHWNKTTDVDRTQMICSATPEFEFICARRMASNCLEVDDDE